MLNKQLFTVAIASVFCCAAVQVHAAKQAKGGGGGGNHMQRGIQLAEEKHYDAAAEELGKAIKDNPKEPLPGINPHWRILRNISNWRRRMPPRTRSTVRPYPR